MEDLIIEFYKFARANNCAFEHEGNKITLGVPVTGYKRMTVDIWRFAEKSKIKFKPMGEFWRPPNNKQVFFTIQLCKDQITA
jgi:hypothetical protein